MSGSQPCFIRFSVSFLCVCAQLLQPPPTPGDPIFCMHEVFHNRIILKAHWNSNRCYKMNRLICADQMLDGHLFAGRMRFTGLRKCCDFFLRKTWRLGGNSASIKTSLRAVFSTASARFLSLGPVLVMLEIAETFSLWVYLWRCLRPLMSRLWLAEDSKMVSHFSATKYSEWMSECWLLWYGGVIHLHVCMLSCFHHVRLSVAPWTAAHQASLSKGLSREELWSGWPRPPPGDLPDPGIKPTSPALQILYHWPTGEASSYT